MCSSGASKPVNGYGRVAADRRGHRADYCAASRIHSLCGYRHPPPIFRTYRAPSGLDSRAECAGLLRIGKEAYAETWQRFEPCHHQFPRRDACRARLCCGRRLEGCAGIARPPFGRRACAAGNSSQCDRSRSGRNRCLEGDSAGGSEACGGSQPVADAAVGHAGRGRFGCAVLVFVGGCRHKWPHLGGGWRGQHSCLVLTSGTTLSRMSCGDVNGSERVPVAPAGHRRSGKSNHIWRIY